MVHSRFRSICATAASPTSGPRSVNATQVGVEMFPSSFGSTFTTPPLHTATRQYVVPKSIPTPMGSSAADVTGNATNEEPVVVPADPNADGDLGKKGFSGMDAGDMSKG
ncbi:hypothetical protein Pelo_178 [Pelomyxa schiedti]|nr:hypothetical protein Pelo_178 [Pelomyxa schiedti]